MDISRTEGRKASAVDDQPKTKYKNDKETIMAATDEQIIYAGILSVGRKLGLVGLITAFVVYLTGILSPKVPLESIPQYWGLSVEQYTKAVGLKAGWSWLGMYGYGDMLNFFGIAILGLISIVCYLAIIPTLVRKKDVTFTIIALTEVLVLALAASGIIGVGE